MEEKLFDTRKDWRAWLRTHHAKKNALWLVFYKKKVNKGRMQYQEAVEEALCYGWIDSTLQRIDEEKHRIKFTPRKPKSNWSKSNKERVKRLISQGKMTKAGLTKIEAAKANGSWDKLVEFEENPAMPVELEAALSKNQKAKDHFDKMAPSHRKQYLWWISSAKKEETRLRRIHETVKRVAEGRSPGM